MSFLSKIFGVGDLTAAVRDSNGRLDAATKALNSAFRIKRAGGTLAIFLAFGLMSGCGKPHGTINQDVDVTIYFNVGTRSNPRKRLSAAQLRVNWIKILQLESGTVFAKLDLKYVNTGKDAVDFRYDDFVLCDAEGRKYPGMVGIDRYGEKAWKLEPGRVSDGSLRPDAWGEFCSSDSFSFIKCNPAMTDESTISFKLPTGAFSGDVSFGFVSILAPDDVQGNILVYEKAKSTYDFTKPGTFTSTDWK
jgi:hypothetical protein